MTKVILIGAMLFLFFGCVSNNPIVITDSKPVVAPETIVTNTVVETPPAATNSTFNTEQYIWDNWSIK